MFSLVISIIAVALVAVLTIATIVYSSNAYEEQRTKSGAAQIINETEQIEGAILAYNVEQGVTPSIKDCSGETDPCEPLEELIDKGYLASAPNADTDSGSSSWAMSAIYDDGTDTVQALVKTVEAAECYQANVMMAFEGITAYNADNGTNPDLVEATDVPSDIDADMLPQCSTVMPTTLVCCQTVEAAS